MRFPGDRSVMPGKDERNSGVEFTGVYFSDEEYGIDEASIPIEAPCCQADALPILPSVF